MSGSANSRILVIEDDPLIGPAVVKLLSSGYQVTLASSLAEADRALDASLFDLIVLDVELPDGDGFRFCGKIRTRSGYKNVPVMFLTGHGDLQDKILGFSIGADDYLNKPFHVEELKLRVSALMKRAQPRQEEPGAVFGDLVLDLRYHKTAVRTESGEEPVHLTALEFKLLHYLASRGGEVCSRDELIREIWGKNVHVMERTIDTHLANLRKKLAHSTWTVLSVHGFGYHWTKKTINNSDSCNDPRVKKS